VTGVIWVRLSVLPEDGKGTDYWNTMLVL